ncbi:MAG TPA: hypothetical protein VOA64_02660 [Candidatus Dormibacteraeota bacterium]|nr:hypothetical protein [Candidatus Dormibacteraeota bacterium]
MDYHYAIVGLQEPTHDNVMSLDQKAAVGNYLRVEATNRQYRIVWCDEPKPTAFEAACLAINDKVTLRVVLDNGDWLPSRAAS